MSRSLLSRRTALRVQRTRVILEHYGREIYATDRLRIPILLVVLIAALIAVLETWSVPTLGSTASRTALSVTEVALGAYISIEVLTGGIRPPARDRIDRPEDVVTYYEERGCDGSFVSLAPFDGWDVTLDRRRKLPAVVESIPDESLPVEQLEANLLDEYYPLSDHEQRIYEPVLDELQDQFQSEGNFNQIKLRPVTVDGARFKMAETTFFNNFATNLSPDYDLYDHRTVRDLLHREVFDPSGTLRPLSETELPYIAAAAGMVVGREGEAIFPIRSRNVVIEGFNLGLSFGGSWDEQIVAAEGISSQIRGELGEERGIPADTDVKIQYLGTLRRLDLLGKPDAFLLAVVDGQLDWSVASREETASVVVDLVPEDVTVEGMEDIYEHVEFVNREISKLLDESPYNASAGLLYWVYLLNRQAQSNATGAE